MEVISSSEICPKRERLEQLHKEYKSEMCKIEDLTVPEIQEQAIHQFPSFPKTMTKRAVIFLYLTWKFGGAASQLCWNNEIMNIRELSSISKTKIMAADNQSTMSTLPWNTPPYDKKVQFKNWLEILETDFLLHDLEDDRKKKMILRIKLGVELLAEIPNTTNNESYSAYKERLVEHFPKGKSQEDYQYMLAATSMEWSVKGLENVVSLIKKAHPNDSSILQGAVLLLQMRKVVKDLPLLREMEHWKNESIHEIKDRMEKEIYRMPHGKQHQKRKMTCFHCNFPGHVEANCDRKRRGLPPGDYVKKKEEERRTKPFVKEELQINRISVPLQSSREITKGNLQYQKAKKRVSVLMDTGSDLNVIHQRLVDELQLPVSNQKICFKALDVSLSAFYVTDNLELNFGDDNDVVILKAPILIREPTEDIIMSNAAVELLKKRQREMVTLEKMFGRKFPELSLEDHQYPSSSKLVCPKLEFMYNELPRFDRYYISPKVKDELKPQIDEMLAKDIFEIVSDDEEEGHYVNAVASLEGEDNIVEEIFDALHIGTNHACPSSYPSSSTSTLEGKLLDCEVCLKNNDIVRKKPESEVITYPFQQVEMDITKIEDRYVLGIVDKFSKFKIYELLCRMTGDAILKAFKKSVVFRYGLPKMVKTDCAMSFTKGKFAKYLMENHVIHNTAIPYEHSTNQVVERSFRQLQLAIRKANANKTSGWKEEFQKVVLEMNLIPGEDGFTPYDILHRFTPRKAFDNKFDLNHHHGSNIAVHAREILNKIKNEPTKVVLKSAFNKRQGKLSSRNKIVKKVLSDDIMGSHVSCDTGNGNEDSNIFKLRILDKKSM
uniref:Integrase catalytic domain-containing protein n=1 Tax=Strongyloides papillosus TaxID=174720 RepID=A0A0N5BLY5_STREA